MSKSCFWIFFAFRAPWRPGFLLACSLTRVSSEGRSQQLPVQFGAWGQRATSGQVTPLPLTSVPQCYQGLMGRDPRPLKASWGVLQDSESRWRGENIYLKEKKAQSASHCKSSCWHTPLGPEENQELNSHPIVRNSPRQSAWTQGEAKVEHGHLPGLP